MFSTLGLDAIKSVMNFWRSVKAFADDVPALAEFPAPFVIDAGLTFATAATAGSINCLAAGDHFLAHHGNHRW